MTWRFQPGRRWPEGFRALGVLLAGLAALVRAGEGSEGWRPLFNGQDLTGWTVQCKPADRARVWWRVEDGTIVGDSLGRATHDYVWLVTREEFGDFELRLEFQAFRHSPGNTGLQIRSRYDEAAGWLDGPQVDIHPPAPWRTGMMWDETRGNQRWLFPTVPAGGWVKESQAPAGVPFHFADGTPSWNQLELSARGPRIRAQLNGVAVTDYDGAGTLDDALHRQRRVGERGHLALQIHTGDELRIRYRKILIRPLEPAAPAR